MDERTKAYKGTDNLYADDLAVWRRGALSAYAHYLMDNPRRYCMKREHPELFTRTNDVAHPRLPLGEAWSGYGNLFLLDKPELHALRVSRRASAEEIEALRAKTLEWVRSGGVVVSPFISPGEKELARSVLDAGGSVILMKPDGFDCAFKPRGRYFDLCVQGRLLILSCRPYSRSAPALTRETCLAMNRWCSDIAQPIA